MIKKLDIDYLNALPPLTDAELDALNEKVDVSHYYNLPADIQYCKKCVISNQRPRITFDDEGVCNACRYWEKKYSVIDWEARERELKTLLQKHKRGDGGFEVLVPSSGGKDSAYVAHLLKFKYGMRVLTFTWAPLVYTAIGYRNFQAHLNAGFDNVTFTANPMVQRIMCRLATIVLGDPFQPFIYGQTYAPLRVAKQFGITLVVDGENGEAEYGGSDEAFDKQGFSESDADEFWLSGFPLDQWESWGLSQDDLELYRSGDISGVQRVFMSYFVNWQPQKHFYYAGEHMNFLPNPLGRSEGTYSKYSSLDDAIDPFHYYFAVLKFGIGRATSDAAHEIREGIIDRGEAVRLVGKYDTDKPSGKSFEIFKEYTGFSDEQLEMCFERWRNNAIWSGFGSSITPR